MGEDLGRKLRNEAFLKAIEIDWWVPSQVPMNRLLGLNRLWRKDYVKECRYCCCQRRKNAESENLGDKLS